MLSCNRNGLTKFERCSLKEKDFNLNLLLNACNFDYKRRSIKNYLNKNHYGKLDLKSLCRYSLVCVWCFWHECDEASRNCSMFCMIRFCHFFCWKRSKLYKLKFAQFIFLRSAENVCFSALAFGSIDFNLMKLNASEKGERPSTRATYENYSYFKRKKEIGSASFFTSNARFILIF